MRVFFVSLFFVSLIAVYGSASPAASQQTAVSQKPANIAGRWHVKFTLVDGSEKNLVFDARADGSGSFQLLDTGPDDKPVTALQPAAWSAAATDRVSISGEVELQVGTCCRQTGTLIFKARFSEGKSFAGRLIFVTNVEEEESPYKFHAATGVFSATRVS